MQLTETEDGTNVAKQSGEFTSKRTKRRRLLQEVADLLETPQAENTVTDESEVNDVLVRSDINEGVLVITSFAT